MIESGYELICNSCRASVSPNAPTCPRCGAPLGGGPSTARMRAAPGSRGEGAIAPVGSLAPAGAVGWYRPASSLLPAEASRYGGFWIRLAANIIDGLVLAVPLLVLESMLGPGIRLLGLVAWLYYPLMESSASQATFGKLACGLRVTDTRGRRISFGRACGRYWAKILSLIPFYLGFLMIGWTARKRGLHDFVAGTLVSRG